MRRVEWSVIHTDLLVGSAPQTAEDFDCLYRDAQVSAVLSLQHDEDLRRAGLTSADLHRMAATRGLLMARCPLRDHDPADQQRGLPAAVRTLHTLRQQGHRVYVHCTLGVNRAPRVVLAYLTWVEFVNLDEAVSRLHRVRPQAFPLGPAYFAVYAALEAQFADRIRQRLSERGEWPLDGWEAGLPSDSALWQNTAREIVREVLTQSNPSVLNAA